MLSATRSRRGWSKALRSNILSVNIFLNWFAKLRLTFRNHYVWLVKTQIDEEQFNKILHFIKSGIEDGATLVSGGERHGDRGYFIKPTIFSDVQVLFNINIHQPHDLAEITKCLWLTFLSGFWRMEWRLPSKRSSGQFNRSWSSRE